MCVDVSWPAARDLWGTKQFDKLRTALKHMVDVAFLIYSKHVQASKREQEIYNLVGDFFGWVLRNRVCVNLPVPQQDVAHDVKEARAEVPMKVRKQALKISVSNVAHMLSRAHMKARAVEHAGGIESFCECVTLPDAVVKSLQEARSESEAYCIQILRGMIDVVNGITKKWGVASDVPVDCNHNSLQRWKDLEAKVAACHLHLQWDRCDLLRNAKTEVWRGHYKPRPSDGVFDFIGLLLRGTSQPYRGETQITTFSVATTLDTTDVAQFVNQFVAIMDEHIAGGAFLIWREWREVDALLKQLTLEWKPNDEWVSQLPSFYSRMDESCRYDAARWVLGKCFEYQESDEDLEALPRFRLKDWNIKLTELTQGDRLLVPKYSHTDLLKFIKILWFFLKPEHEERDGMLHQVLKFVSVAHEACSTSFLINGFAFDVVWTLNPSLEHEIKVMLLFLFPFPLLSHIISLPPPCLSHFHSLLLLFFALLLSSLSYGGLTWLLPDEVPSSSCSFPVSLRPWHPCCLHLSVSLSSFSSSCCPPQLLLYLQGHVPKLWWRMCVRKTFQADRRPHAFVLSEPS